MQKSAQECEKKELEYGGERWAASGEFQKSDVQPPTPAFFVSADSERLKVAVFSVSWERFASADSKGVRRSAWRERMVRWVRKNRAELTKVL